MTKEQAIEQLKQIDTLALPQGYLGEMQEAIEMGIKALQCVIESERCCRELFNKAGCKLSYEDFIKDVYKKS